MWGTGCGWRPGFGPTPLLLQIGNLRLGQSLGQSLDQQARAMHSPPVPSPPPGPPQPLGSTHTFQAPRTPREGDAIPGPWSVHHQGPKLSFLKWSKVDPAGLASSRHMKTLCPSQLKGAGQDMPHFVLLMIKAKNISSSWDIAQDKELSHLTRSFCTYT